MHTLSNDVAQVTGLKSHELLALRKRNLLNFGKLLEVLLIFLYDVILYFRRRPINTSAANNNMNNFAGGGWKCEISCRMHDRQVAQSALFISIMHIDAEIRGKTCSLFSQQKVHNLKEIKFLHKKKKNQKYLLGRNQCITVFTVQKAFQIFFQVIAVFPKPICISS